jgi:hypothetical protein
MEERNEFLKMVSSEFSLFLSLCCETLVIMTENLFCGDKDALDVDD